MKIERVEYRRLHTFGQFENHAIGAVAVVEPGEDPSEALKRVEEWVNNQLGTGAESAELRVNLRDLRAELENRRYDLRRLEGDLETAKERWEKAQGFLEKHGIPADRWGEIPF